MQHRDFGPIRTEIAKIQGSILYDNVRALCIFQESKGTAINAVIFPLRALLLRMIQPKELAL